MPVVVIPFVVLALLLAAAVVTGCLVVAVRARSCPPVTTNRAAPYAGEEVTR